MWRTSLVSLWRDATPARTPPMAALAAANAAARALASGGDAAAGLRAAATAGVPADEVGMRQWVGDRARARRRRAPTTSPPPLLQLWRATSKLALTPGHAHALHVSLHAACYARWDESSAGPAPWWTPTREGAAGTNLNKAMASYRGGPAWTSSRTGDPCADLPLFQRLSVDDPETWWRAVLPELGIRFSTPPARILDRPPPDAPDAAVWLPGARLNAAACALYGRDDDAVALLCADEAAPARVATTRLGELKANAAAAGAALAAAGIRPRDSVAIIMPLTAEAVALYLGAILIGAVPASVAESFAAPEIAARLRLADAKLVVCAGCMRRGGKDLDLYGRVAAGAETAARALGRAVPLAVAGRPPPALRPGHTLWQHALDRLPPGAAATLAPAAVAAGAPLGLLFSSGTTGDPKAIPWTHATPIRCAVDCWANLDVRARDVLAWPTSLGWMMGAFSIFGALLPGAALALFDGAPTGPEFGAFVQAARVTMLGVVPSLVRAWRATGALSGCDLASIRCFGSTGEASSPDDQAWLAAQARYAPVLELCGGTEVGGAYASGSLLSPWVPATFSTPAMGASFVLLLDDGSQSAHGDLAAVAGEVALVPPLLGSSQALARGGHGAAYYDGMPRAAHLPHHPVLRRHGDEFARLAGGALYAARGRADDAMNLGGVKVSATEVERAVLGDAACAACVAEVAAVGVPGAGGGPEALVLAVVPRGGGAPSSASAIRSRAQSAIRLTLNPLFRVDRVAVVAALPRTATGKVMRRELRAALRGGGRL